MISQFRHLRTYCDKIFTNRRQLFAITSTISVQRNVSYEEVRKLSSPSVDHSKENLLSVANLSHLTSQICALRSFSTSSRLFESYQSDSETKNHIRHLEIMRSSKNEKMIIVQNLSEEIPQDVIREYFSRFGDVDMCVTFHLDGCLIIFKSPNAVNNVLSCAPHYAIGDRIKNEIETKASKSMTPTKVGSLLALGMLASSTTVVTEHNDEDDRDDEEHDSDDDETDSDDDETDSDDDEDDNDDADGWWGEDNDGW